MHAQGTIFSHFKSEASLYAGNILGLNSGSHYTYLESKLLIFGKSRHPLQLLPTGPFPRSRQGDNKINKLLPALWDLHSCFLSCCGWCTWNNFLTGTTSFLGHCHAWGSWSVTAEFAFALYGRRYCGGTRNG